MSFEAPNSQDKQTMPIPSCEFYTGQELYAPPKPEDMILPDGYVYPAEREYPLSPQASQSAITLFDEYKDNFVGAFKPNQTVASIKNWRARWTGKKLHRKGYEMIMSGQINRLDDTRTVAQVLSMDFNCPNALLIRYLKEGAVVAPSVIFESPGKRPHYCSGVGLWMRKEQFDGLSQ